MIYVETPLCLITETRTMIRLKGSKWAGSLQRISKCGIVSGLGEDATADIIVPWGPETAWLTWGLGTGLEGINIMARLRF